MRSGMGRMVGGLVLTLWCVTLWQPPGSVAQRAAVFAQVGARTAFERSQALDLADYCHGTDMEDDTSCMAQWLAAAHEQGQHLYASAGTYYYARAQAIFPGFHLQCASSTHVTFTALNNASNLFVLTADSGVTAPEPWQDVSIENCGFDLNGSTANFAGVIALKGDTAPVQYVTVRGNRIFDSTMPGHMYTHHERQRQYIAILYAEDVLIEHNTLSEGGRIKAGRPGRRIVIRHNSLHNINDNAITVVDRGGRLSSDFLIEGNRITNPLGSGIFFGTDGQKAGTAATRLYDVTVRNNTITGYFQTACIMGVLPNNVARIYLLNNTCHKTDPPSSKFVVGIGLNRNNTAVRPVRDLTIHNNRIGSDVPDAYGNTAGIMITDRFENLCLLENTITNQRLALRLRRDITGLLLGNDLTQGRVSAGTNVDLSDTGACWMPCPSGLAWGTSTC
jgi:hypothetical protein